MSYCTSMSMIPSQEPTTTISLFYVRYVYSSTNSIWTAQDFLYCSTHTSLDDFYGYDESNLEVRTLSNS